MIDLHIHTNTSDGSDEPKDILIKAQQLGLKYISITDHDSIGAYKKLKDVSIHNYFDGKLIPGCEFSAVHNGKPIEILGYGIDFEVISSTGLVSDEKFYERENTYLNNMKDISNLPSELLNEKHGVFVSLKKFGSLRGCIGTIAPTTNSVGEEIMRNAIEAALNDPRFEPVHEDELEDIDISVDVLMDAVKSSKDELDPRKYGVIVTKGYRRGLLLPDLEGVDTVEEQLNIACSKAGIDDEEDFEIEKFEVIRYKEGE